MFTNGTPERALVDVNEAIREMTRLWATTLTRNSISLETTLAEDVPPILGDRVQLQQVMLNLIVNSIEAMKEADGTRELSITTQRGDAQEVLVSVSDTGIGLPQSPGKIFNAFFTTKVRGTGMCRRISRSIIESHSGRLWAADNSPRGTSFYLTLPVPVGATL